MTSRGPLAGNVHKLPARRRAVSPDIAPTREAPPAPQGLGTVGEAAWVAVMTHAPMLLPNLDATTVRRFCDLIDERAALRTELERGVILEKPVVSPRGDVVGTELYANPVVAMLRAVDKELDALCDRLALVPAARARLGLELTTAERQAAEVSTLLSGRFKSRDDA